jgi:lysophospholipase L1-like esterase
MVLRKSILYAFLGVFVAALGFVVAQQPASPAAVPARVMALGDSITAAPGCWRAYLWQQLQATGYTNVDFVGTMKGDGCGFAYDDNHEGHSGFLATGIASQNQLPPWLAASNPDIVIMHLGTNDMWGGQTPVSTVLAAYTTLVNQMRANNPNMKIIVAQILPMGPPACTACTQAVVNLNAAIPGWAAGLTTATSPIVVVDQWTGFNVSTDTGDGVHPNDAGFRKMAAKYYTPLTRLIDGVTPQPSGSSSSSRPASPSSSASPSQPSNGSCTATYTVVGQWQGGFQAEVAVRNNTTGTTSTWTSTIRYANGQQVTQSWSTTISQSGPTVTARPAGYNASLPPGGSTIFGFLGSWTGTNGTPEVTCAVS